VGADNYGGLAQLLGEPGTTDHAPSEVIYADQASVLTRH
jgi:hypothetical protein